MQVTPYSVFYERFYFRILKDDKFFNYNNVSAEECAELAKQRANSYLKEAIKELNLNCNPQVNFYDKDDLLEQFNFEATDLEIEIIVDLMFEAYVKEDITKLKIGEVIYGTKDLSVFSPANDRKTFMEMFDTLVYNNRKSIEKYSSMDRKTGKIVSLNYDFY